MTASPVIRIASPFEEGRTARPHPARYATRPSLCPRLSRMARGRSGVRAPVARKQHAFTPQAGRGKRLTIACRAARGGMRQIAVVDLFCAAKASKYTREGIP